VRNSILRMHLAHKPALSRNSLGHSRSCQISRQVSHESELPVPVSCVPRPQPSFRLPIVVLPAVGELTDPSVLR
jgi:hypothetical protein